MKKIKIKIIADNKVGLKKGEEKTLMPDVARRLIKKGVAEFIEEVEFSNKNDKSPVTLEGLGELIQKLEDATSEIETLKTEQAESKKLIQKLEDATSEESISKLVEKLIKKAK